MTRRRKRPWRKEARKLLQTKKPVGEGKEGLKPSLHRGALRGRDRGKSRSAGSETAQREEQPADGTGKEGKGRVKRGTVKKGKKSRACGGEGNGK